MKQLDLTKPVQQQDGTPVEIICTTADCWVDGVHFPVVGIAGKFIPRSYRANGRRFGDDAPSPFDLINTPVKRRVTGWMNVYPDGTCSIPFSKKEVADATATRIACIHIDIEYTEGDGLDGAE